MLCCRQHNTGLVIRSGSVKTVPTRPKSRAMLIQDLRITLTYVILNAVKDLPNQAPVFAIWRSFAAKRRAQDDEIGFFVSPVILNRERINTVILLSNL